MDNEKIFTMSFAKVYPLLIAKAERKGRGAGDNVLAHRLHPMQDIRYLDKLVDELAKGKPMEKILRC